MFEGTSVKFASAIGSRRVDGYCKYRETLTLAIAVGTRAHVYWQKVLEGRSATSGL